MTGGPPGARSGPAGGRHRRPGLHAAPTRATRCSWPARRPRRPCPGAPFLEVGSYCGKSSVYLGAAARAAGTVLFALDHHRGSEENQAGWEWHEPDLVDPEVGRMDTLPWFRRTIHDAGLEGSVVALVGDSPDGRPATGRPRWRCSSSTAATAPSRPTATTSAGRRTSHPAACSCIHDVFPDPADGGRPPYEIYLPGARERPLRATCRPPARSGCCAASDRRPHRSPSSGHGPRRPPAAPG